jgi:hypothetical protein
MVEQLRDSLAVASGSRDEVGPLGNVLCQLLDRARARGHRLPHFVLELDGGCRRGSAEFRQLSGQTDPRESD